MTTAAEVLDWDAVVVGGGFYGAAIAIYLAKHRGLKRVLVVERESTLLARASFNNQARVHNGYHYPRSFTTAYRSRVNSPKFLRDWSDAIWKDFTKLYAIARYNSKVTGKQFERFCREVGAKIQPAEPAHRALFESRLIEDVFLVEECAFDSSKLAKLVLTELDMCGICTRVETRVTQIWKKSAGALSLAVQPDSGPTELISCRYLFNCTYSGLNQFCGDFPGTQTILKQEIAEIALVEVPQALRNLGITVMDGPFFSIMPFPARGMHTLSHVRYTPHMHWEDVNGIDPYLKLAKYEKDTRVARMIRDVERYLPAVRGVTYAESLFEIKTVLATNETDDGRPILFEKYLELPGFFTILGGKIDNIYDVLEKLDAEKI